MLDIEFYPIVVFIIILLAGCSVNLLKRHYVVQLAGISLMFTYAVFKCRIILHSSPNLSIGEIYSRLLPSFSGIAACLISMTLGFWIFPDIRRKFKK